MLVIVVSGFRGEIDNHLPASCYLRMFDGARAEAGQGVCLQLCMSVATAADMSRQPTGCQLLGAFSCCCCCSIKH